jgi:Hemerythrin HHE cation binding domain
MNLRTLMQAGPARANELFAKLSDTSDGAVKTRERLFGELKAELELHCGLEEEHLFPILRKNPETKPLVADAIRDNKELRAKLAELEILPKNDAAFPERLADLQKAFRQHARDEKKELLPAVQRALSEDQVQVVAERIEANLAEVEEAKQAEAEERRAKARQEREQAERQAAEQAEAERQAQIEAEQARKIEAERKQKAEAERVRQVEALTRTAMQAEEGVRRIEKQVTDDMRSVGTAVRDATEAYASTAQLAADNLRVLANHSSATLGSVVEVQSVWMEWLGKTATTGTQMSQDLLRQTAERQQQLAAEAVQTSEKLLWQAAEVQRQFAVDAMQSWMESNARIMQISLCAALSPFSGGSAAGSGNPDNGR